LVFVTMLIILAWTVFPTRQTGQKQKKHHHRSIVLEALLLTPDHLMSTSSSKWHI